MKNSFKITLNNTNSFCRKTYTHAVLIRNKDILTENVDR